MVTLDKNKPIVTKAKPIAVVPKKTIVLDDVVVSKSPALGAPPSAGILSGSSSPTVAAAPPVETVVTEKPVAFKAIVLNTGNSLERFDNDLGLQNAAKVYAEQAPEREAAKEASAKGYTGKGMYAVFNRTLTLEEYLDLDMLARAAYIKYAKENDVPYVGTGDIIVFLRELTTEEYRSLPTYDDKIRYQAWAIHEGYAHEGGFKKNFLTRGFKNLAEEVFEAVGNKAGYSDEKMEEILSSDMVNGITDKFASGSTIAVIAAAVGAAAIGAVGLAAVPAIGGGTAAITTAPAVLGAPVAGGAGIAGTGVTATGAVGAVGAGTKLFSDLDGKDKTGSDVMNDLSVNTKPTGNIPTPIETGGGTGAAPDVLGTVTDAVNKAAGTAEKAKGIFDSFVDGFNEIKNNVLGTTPPAGGGGSGSSGGSGLIIVAIILLVVAMFSRRRSTR